MFPADAKSLPVRLGLRAESVDELGDMVDLCVEWSKQNGVEFAPAKSKWLRMGYHVGSKRYGRRKRVPNIDGDRLDEVDEFKYLGVNFERSMC